MNNYDDIIKRDRPVSKKHPKLSIAQRSAQFAPFSALSGYEGLISETGRLTNEKIEIDEDRLNAINEELKALSKKKNTIADIVYFKPDAYKQGGAYLEETVQIKKVDEDNLCLITSTGLRINFEDILEINRRKTDE